MLKGDGVVSNWMHIRRGYFSFTMMLLVDSFSFSLHLELHLSGVSVLYWMEFSMEIVNISLLHLMLELHLMMDFSLHLMRGLYGHISNER